MASADLPSDMEVAGSAGVSCKGARSTKVLILADLEGVSGVGDYRLLIPAGPIYQQACENLTEDINAAV